MNEGVAGFGPNHSFSSDGVAQTWLNLDDSSQEDAANGGIELWKMSFVHPISTNFAMVQPAFRSVISPGSVRRHN
jgi:hypothetical protein